MALFQDFGKRLSDTAKSVGRKAQEASELSKMSGQLADLTQEIERLYVQVGKAYYAQRPADGVCDAADLFCERIHSLTEEAAALESAIERKRNRNRCVACGATLSPQAKFCPQCGAKLSREAEEIEEQDAKEEAPANQENPAAEAVEKTSPAEGRAVEITWPEATAKPVPKPDANPPEEEKNE